MRLERTSAANMRAGAYGSESAEPAGPVAVLFSGFRDLW